MNILSMVLQEHAEEAPNVFALTTNVSAWTLIIFIVLLVVLSRFAFPHILGYAAAREKRIQDALDDAKRQREETEALLAQQRAELANARVEAQALIAEGKTAADKVRAELIERARGEGDAMIQRARTEIERERAQAIDSLRREAVELAIAAAARLTGQRLGTDEDRKLVTDFLGTVQTGAGAAGKTGVGAA
ncbi:MAG TPA: F0F1 ATP synthase subunit B [Longimicrobiales bacterium]